MWNTILTSRSKKATKNSSLREFFAACCCAVSCPRWLSVRSAGNSRTITASCCIAPTRQRAKAVPGSRASTSLRKPVRRSAQLPPLLLQLLLLLRLLVQLRNHQSLRLPRLQQRREEHRARAQPNRLTLHASARLQSNEQSQLQLPRFRLHSALSQARQPNTRRARCTNTCPSARKQLPQRPRLQLLPRKRRATRKRRSCCADSMLAMSHLAIIHHWCDFDFLCLFSFS